MLVCLVPVDVVDLLDLDEAVDGFLVLADANDTPETFVRDGGGTLDLFVRPALSAKVSRGASLRILVLAAAEEAISRCCLFRFCCDVYSLLPAPAFAIILGFWILLFNCESLTSPRLVIVALVARVGNALGGRIPDGFFTVCSLPVSSALFTLKGCSAAQATHRRLQIIHDAQR